MDEYNILDTISEYHVKTERFNLNLTLFIDYLQGSTVGDVMCSFFCGPCVSCQTAVEIKERGDKARASNNPMITQQPDQARTSNYPMTHPGINDNKWSVISEESKENCSTIVQI